MQKAEQPTPRLWQSATQDAPTAIPAVLEEPKTPIRADIKTYQPRQDNRALVAAGQAARSDLERAARKYAKHPAIEVTGTQEVQGTTFVAGGQAAEASSTALKSSGWNPAGCSVEVAGRTIPGMVYVGTPPRLGEDYYHMTCRAYIIPSLPVGATHEYCRSEDLGYWPDYSRISPSCRAAYLDWLAAGAEEPQANVGFVFLYFYGLERRMFVDDCSADEKVALIEEVKRLRLVYGGHHSVNRYLGEFIEAATFIAGQTSDVEPFFDWNSWELPLSLRVRIGVMIRDDQRLSAEWLLSWFICSNQYSLRTPVRRCPDEFKAMFSALFDEKHSKGLKVRKPKASLTHTYQAASREFEKRLPLLVDGEPVPDIAALGGPLKQADKLAAAACDALDAYSRYLGRNPDAGGSLEAHALLPYKIIAEFPCAAKEELSKWVRKVIDAGGLVPVIELLDRLNGSTPSSTMKKRLTEAAQVLSSVGFAMAPDPKFGLRAPKLDEPVVLFDLSAEAQFGDDVSDSYKRVLLEMALGTLVAHADGTMVEAERERLVERAETAPVANEGERRRLQANRVWFEAVKPDIAMLRTSLKKAGQDDVMVLRSAAIAMAHADLAVVPEEVAGIERIYQSLGLDRSLVYADLHAGGPADGPVSVRSAVAEQGGETIVPDKAMDHPGLDEARIAAIRSDTQRVSSVLAGIFSAGEDNGEGAHDWSEPDGSSDGASQSGTKDDEAFAGLDDIHAAFVGELLTKSGWTEDEMNRLAAVAGLPLSGMLETVNEWSFDRHNEMLVDDYEGYEVIGETADAIRKTMKGAE